MAVSTCSVGNFAELTKLRAGLVGCWVSWDGRSNSLQQAGRTPVRSCTAPQADERHREPRPGGSWRNLPRRESSHPAPVFLVADASCRLALQLTGSSRRVCADLSCVFRAELQTCFGGEKSGVGSWSVCKGSYVAGALKLTPVWRGAARSAARGRASVDDGAQRCELIDVRGQLNPVLPEFRVMHCPLASSQQSAEDSGELTTCQLSHS